MSHEAKVFGFGIFTGLTIANLFWTILSWWRYRNDARNSMPEKLRKSFYDEE
jgi:hypothetical protein